MTIFVDSLVKCLKIIKKIINFFFFQDVEYVFYDPNQAQARRWFLDPSQAAYICRRSDKISSGQAYTFRLAHGSPIFTTAYSEVKMLVEELFPHPFDIPLQLRVTQYGSTTSYTYRAYPNGNSWARLPSPRYSSTPNLPCGQFGQVSSSYQLPFRSLPRNIVPSSRRLPSVGGSLYESLETVPSEPSSSSVDPPVATPYESTPSANPTVITPYENRVEANTEDDTILLDFPASPVAPAPTASPWMDNVPTLATRNVRLNLEDETTASHVSAARTLNTLAADNASDESDELNQIFFSEDLGSTRDESQKSKSDQDSASHGKKDDDNNLSVSFLYDVIGIFPHVFVLSPSHVFSKSFDNPLFLLFYPFFFKTTFSYF